MIPLCGFGPRMHYRSHTSTFWRRPRGGGGDAGAGAGASACGTFLIFFSRSPKKEVLFENMPILAWLRQFAKGVLLRGAAGSVGRFSSSLGSSRTLCGEFHFSRVVAWKTLLGPRSGGRGEGGRGGSTPQ